MGETFLTKAGFEKLQQEHKALQRQKRQLAEEVNTAAALGDLRENAEYQVAKEKLLQVTGRLGELDRKLTNVRIIDELEVKAGEARLGMRVTLKDLQTDEAFSYVLVGPDEADPQRGTISAASPLGRGMLGRKPGEEFVLELPKGKATYRVLKIDRPAS